MNKNITFFVRILLFELVFLIVVCKLFGFPARYDVTPSNPYSWKEIYQILPIIIFISSLIGIFATILYSQAKKNDEWRLNEARKRIAEREKKEKEEQAEEQRNENK